MGRLLTSSVRFLASTIALMLLVALAALGAATAISAIGEGPGGLSIPGLADFLGLPGLRDSAGELLASVEAPGPVAVGSALGGAAAILLGTILIIGTLARPTERLMEAVDSEQGRLASRPRPLAAAAADLARGTDGVTEARAKARPSRGGRLNVVVRHRYQDRAELESRVASALSHLRTSFGLRTRVQIEEGGRGSRVE